MTMTPSTTSRHVATTGSPNKAHGRTAPTYKKIIWGLAIPSQARSSLHTHRAHDPIHNLGKSLALAHFRKPAVPVERAADDKARKKVVGADDPEETQREKAETNAVE
jgi:hypothetical protein